MSDTAPPAYTLRSIQQMLGLSRGAVMGLVGAGFVAPGRGTRNEYLFSFQDLLLLRTAQTLRTAAVPPRRILRSLAQLRAALPATLPLSGLRISAVGGDIAVHDGGTPWSASSGQLLMDFDVAPDRGGIAFLQRLPTPPAGAPDPTDPHALFAAGAALEASDPPGAEASYRAALALDPTHTDAWLNLGALLCDAGRCDEALAVFDEALARCPGVAALQFNRAIALEDQGREAQAIASYEAALSLDASLADAHFNAARLSQKLGDGQGALRHLSAYRRMQDA